MLVGISVGCFMGCFPAPLPWRKAAPLKIGNASLLILFLFINFAPLDPPPFPNQQSDGFPLGFLLQGPPDTQPKLRTNPPKIANKQLGRAKGDAPKVTEPNLQFPAVFCENLGFSAKICKGPDCVADPFGTVPRRGS